MTLEELWNRKIDIKWMPVHIQGRRIKDFFLRKELVARLDSSLDGYLSHSSGFSEAISVASEEPWHYSCYRYNQKHLFPCEPEMFDSMNETREEWKKWWGASPYSGEDSTIFSMNVFNDSYRDCFFNPKTGKVGLTHNIGKWIGNMSELKGEIEWFAEQFPEVELYLTFEDYVKNDKDPFYTEPFATIHLDNGKIEIVKTRKVKPIKNPIDHSKLYYSITSFFRKLFRQIYQKINYERYVYYHNYKLLGAKSAYRYYDIYQLLEVCEWWRDTIRERE